MIALITGASNGIGREVALRLASHYGATVVALSRNVKRLEELSRNTSGDKGRIIPLPADLLTIDTDSLTGKLREEGVEKLDVLVNNAGFLVNKPFNLLEAGDWQQVYETNVFAPARLISALLPILECPPFAHVVNIGSYGGFQGSAKFAGLSAYSSSKAALANLSECLAEELREKNIRVNCLALGAVDTEMLQQAFPGYTAPLSPGKMAEFIAWFAAEGGAFFNGKVLPVTLEGV